MVLCPYCKQIELSDNAKFCGKCGHKIAHCPTCGRILTTNQKFCKNDGTLLGEELLKDLPEPTTSGPETSEKPTQGGTDKDDATVLLRDKPNTAVRFCKQCGKPCAPGQTLCEECSRKAASTQVKDPKPRSNKRLVIVIAVVLVLLIAAGVVVAVKTGLFSGASGEKDKPETDTTESDSLLPISEDDDSSEALEAEEGASAVSLDTLTATLSADDSTLLTAVVTPENWDGELTWSSSNEEVATVTVEDDYTATVRYVGAGTCSITVSAEGASASCVVTCEEIEEEETGSETADQDKEEITIPAPVNYMYYNGHTYAIYNVKNEDLYTWNATVSFCESLGGHLAVINSEAENDVLYQFVLDSGLHLCFFGYSDAGSEGNWQWVYGDSDYENWANGQPNNGANNNSDAAENYAEFFESTADGTWNDAPFATNTYHFICEWETDDVTFDN